MRGVQPHDIVPKFDKLSVFTDIMAYDESSVLIIFEGCDYACFGFLTMLI